MNKRIKYALMISTCLLASSSLAAPSSIAIQLINAAENGQSQLLESLLTQGAFVDERGQFGTTALMRASMKGRRDIVELLIKNGANVDAQDSGGATALHIASREGKAEIVKILLAARAIVDTKDGENWTPLMRAASRGRLDVVNVLLTAGADPNIKNDWSETALVYAMKSGKTEVAEALLAKGASKDVADIEGRNFQQIAASKKMEFKEPTTQLANNISSGGSGGGNALALSTSIGKPSSGQIVLAQLDSGDLSRLSPASGGIVTGGGGNSVSSGGGYIVQFSHFKEDDAARAINKANEIWNTFAKKSPDAMSKVRPVLSKTRLPEENTVLFQVRGGYFPTETAAKDFCSKLNLNSSECLIIPQSDAASSTLASVDSSSAPQTTQKNAMVITGPVLSSISAPVESVTTKELNPGIVKQKQEPIAEPVVTHQVPSKFEIAEPIKSEPAKPESPVSGEQQNKTETSSINAPSSEQKFESAAVKKEPAPVTLPEPVLEKIAEKKAEPIVTAKAEPAPIATPEPVVEKKEPAPVATPEPVAEKIAEKKAEPIITAKAEPAPIATPEPVAEKKEPEPVAALEKKVEPEPISTAKKEPEKSAEFVITATDDPAPIAKPEPVPEKIAEKKAEPEPKPDAHAPTVKSEAAPENPAPQTMAMNAPAEEAIPLSQLAPAARKDENAKQYRYVKKVTRNKKGRKVVRYRKVLVASSGKVKTGKNKRLTSRTSESITAQLNRQQIAANNYPTSHTDSPVTTPEKNKPTASSHDELPAKNELAPNLSKDFFTTKEAEKLLESQSATPLAQSEPDLDKIEKAKIAPIVVYPPSADNSRESAPTKRESKRADRKNSEQQVSTAEFLDYQTQSAAPTEAVKEISSTEPQENNPSARKMSHAEKMKERRRARNEQRDKRKQELAAAAMKARQIARMQRHPSPEPDDGRAQEFASAKQPEQQKPDDSIDNQMAESIEPKAREKIAKPKIKISKKSQAEIRNSRRKPNAQQPAEDDIIAARKSLEVARDIDSSKIEIPAAKNSAGTPPPPPETTAKSAIEAAVKAPETTEPIAVKKIEVKEAVRVPLSGNNFGGSESFKLSSPKMIAAGTQPIIPILQQLPAADPNLISVQVSYFDSQAVIQAFAASMKQNVASVANKSFVILTGQNQDNGPLVLAITGLTSTNESTQVCDFVKKQGYICNATQNTAQNNSPKEPITLDAPAAKSDKTRIYTLLGGYKSAYDANNAWSEIIASSGSTTKDANHMVTKKSAGINTVFQLKAGPFESPQKAKSFCEKIGDRADLCEVED